MKNENLQQYYEQVFAPNNLPAHTVKPFSETDEDFRRALENTLGFSSWQLRRSVVGLFQQVMRTRAFGAVRKGLLYLFPSLRP